MKRKTSRMRNPETAQRWTIEIRMGRGPWQRSTVAESTRAAANAKAALWQSSDPALDVRVVPISQSYGYLRNPDAPMTVAQAEAAHNAALADYYRIKAEYEPVYQAASEAMDLWRRTPQDTLGQRSGLYREMMALEDRRAALGHRLFDATHRLDEARYEIDRANRRVDPKYRNPAMTISLPDDAHGYGRVMGKGLKHAARGVGHFLGGIRKGLKENPAKLTASVRSAIGNYLHFQAADHTPVAEIIPQPKHEWVIVLQDGREAFLRIPGRDKGKLFDVIMALPRKGLKQNPAHRQRHAIRNPAGDTADVVAAAKAAEADLGVAMQVAADHPRDPDVIGALQDARKAFDKAQRELSAYIKAASMAQALAAAK